jgi:hypothetical protein
MRRCRRVGRGGLRLGFIGGVELGTSSSKGHTSHGGFCRKACHMAKQRCCIRVRGCFIGGEVLGTNSSEPKLGVCIN